MIGISYNRYFPAFIPTPFMNLSLQSIQSSTPIVPPTQSAAYFESGGYDRVFWATFFANSALMVAVSLLFRYSDFVTHADGSAIHLGTIVGIGTIGALVVRVFQGVGIDRFGPRRVWLVSLGIFIVSMWLHACITSVHGVSVYIARFLMMTSLAGAFGASITYISLRVPERRMAEMIGTLGSSGFIGIALGPTLGDLCFGTGAVTRLHIERMFLLAMLMGVLSFLCAAVATNSQIRIPVRRNPSPVKAVRKYHPGLMLFVAIAVGWAVGIPGTFLRPYGEGLGIAGLRVFFLTYAASAFVVRISARRLPERIGFRPMIVTGFTCLASSMLLYLVVRHETLMMIPAVMAGAGHALLFPSVTAGGCSHFPTRYRGLATTLMLAMYDVGSLVGQPVIGSIVEFSGAFGLPPYATMFVSMSIGLYGFALTYWLLTIPRRAKIDQDVEPVEANRRVGEEFVSRESVGADV